jgi:type IV pilus assembly protein PilX
LCTHAADDHAIHIALADGGGPGIVLGAYTGASIPSGAGALAARAPRYLIESMPSSPDALLYRITALGFGSAGTTQVAVQAYYRKLLIVAAPPGPLSPGAPSEPTEPASPAASGTGTAVPAPGTPGGPGVRVSWREIANWHDGVAAATEAG